MSKKIYFGEFGKSYTEAEIMAALEKQEPKKVINLIAFSGDCPCCRFPVYSSDKYCCWCGQKLDFGKDKSNV